MGKKMTKKGKAVVGAIALACGIFTTNALLITWDNVTDRFDEVEAYNEQKVVEYKQEVKNLGEKLID